MRIIFLSVALLTAVVLCLKAQVPPPSDKKSTQPVSATNPLPENAPSFSAHDRELIVAARRYAVNDRKDTVSFDAYYKIKPTKQGYMVTIAYYRLDAEGKPVFDPYRPRVYLDPNGKYLGISYPDW